MENDRQFKNILSSRCLWELRKTRREEVIVKSRNKSIRTTKNESQQIQPFPLFSLCMHLSQLIGGMIQIKVFSILALSIYWLDDFFFFFLWGMLSYLYCGTCSNVPGLNCWKSLSICTSSLGWRQSVFSLEDKILHG